MCGAGCATSRVGRPSPAASSRAARSRCTATTRPPGSTSKPTPAKALPGCDAWPAATSTPCSTPLTAGPIRHCGPATTAASRLPRSSSVSTTRTVSRRGLSSPRDACSAATSRGSPTSSYRISTRTHSPPPSDGACNPASALRQTGAVRLLVMADTHVPRRARDLPTALWDAVEDADVVVHAGDWVDVGLLDSLERRARRLVAVYGNNDGPDLRSRLPEVARVDLDGLRLTVVHETGSRTGRERRCAAQFPDTDVLVFGHSHIPWDTTADGGLRLLNPGSPTDRRRQPHHTYATALVDGGRLSDVQLHHLPPRS